MCIIIQRYSSSGDIDGLVAKLGQDDAYETSKLAEVVKCAVGFSELQKGYEGRVRACLNIKTCSYQPRR